MNYADYQRAFDATMGRSGNPNPEKSFRAWQHYAATVRQKLYKITKMYEDDRESILREYSTGKASEMLAERQKWYAELCRHAEEAVRKDLETVIASKRAAIRAASTAPSAEDLRLLQTLALRASLSDSDVVYAAEAIGSNLVALGTLADLAERHGVNLPIPSLKKIEESLENAIAYAEERVKELSLSDRQLGYKGTEFYNFPDSDTGFAACVFDELDTSAFTSEQKKADTIDLEAVKNAIKAKHEARSTQFDDDRAVENNANP